MRIPLLVLALLVAIPAGQRVAAQSSGRPVVAFYNGNDLQQLFDKPVDSINGALLGGYISGVYDELSLKGSICPAKEVTIGQARVVVIKWFQAHPRDWHQAAVNLVRNGLEDAFHCKK